MSMFIGFLRMHLSMHQPKGCLRLAHLLRDEPARRHVPFDGGRDDRLSPGGKPRSETSATSSRARFASGLLDLKDTGVTFLRPVSVIRGPGAWPCMMKLGFGVTGVGVIGSGQFFLIGRPQRSEPGST